jgi:sodium transport system permease protein
MRLSNIRTVLWKEVIDTLRDGRTLFLLVALPLVMYPALFAGLGYFERLMREKQEEATISVMVVNPGGAPGLVDALSGREKLNVVRLPKTDEASASRLIREEVVQVALLVPPAFEESLTAGKTATLALLYDGASIASADARDKITAAVGDYKSELVRKRLETRGLDITILDTVRIDPRNVATAGEMGAFVVSMMVPFFLIILMCAGAQHTAIDVTAGEKERSTLETVLTTSASRTEIVFGKFLAVLLTACATTLTGLTGLLITIFGGLSFISGEAGQKLVISPGSVLALLATLIPAMIFVAATFVAIGCFAKSTKEGQTYSSYFYMVIMVAAVVTIFPGVDMGIKGFAIPLIGVLFLGREILSGGFVLSHVAAALVSTLAIAVGALVLSVRLFSNEKVMFRI